MAVNFGALVAYLESQKNNRGLMADLRRGLTESTEVYAWPHLSKFCGLDNKLEFDVVRTVAGLYAYHPMNVPKVNIGSLCFAMLTEEEQKDILNGEGKDDGAIAMRLFQLLNSDREELLPLVGRLVLYAGSKEVGLDYEQLGRDLLFWNDRVRRTWASSFWRPVQKKEGESE